MRVANIASGGGFGFFARPGAPIAEAKASAAEPGGRTGALVGPARPSLILPAPGPDASDAPA